MYNTFKSGPGWFQSPFNQFSTLQPEWPFWSINLMMSFSCIKQFHGPTLLLGWNSSFLTCPVGPWVSCLLHPTHICHHPFPSATGLCPNIFPFVCSSLCFQPSHTQFPLLFCFSFSVDQLSSLRLRISTGTCLPLEAVPAPPSTD